MTGVCTGPDAWSLPSSCRALTVTGAVWGECTVHHCGLRTWTAVCAVHPAAGGTQAAIKGVVGGPCRGLDAGGGAQVRQVTHAGHAKQSVVGHLRFFSNAQWGLFDSRL